MLILVLNAGSSSIKFQLIDMGDERTLARGAVERIGASDSLVRWSADERETKTGGEILDHGSAVRAALAALASGGVLDDPERIVGVGHRVVHGGERFSASAEMTDEVVAAIEDAIELAPLHNPHNLRGYLAARAALPHARHVAVFDTAFHAAMPPRAWLYALPRAIYDRHRVRRYGFHGTSHRYVAGRYAELAGRPLAELKLISLHLGNGCSACAIDGGRSVDTSMGFTPLEGLVMGTRSGDVDVAAVLHVMAKEELSLHEASSLLNKHSGLQGLSGLSNDMRRLLEASDGGDERAREAIEVFCYRARKYVGAYLAALGGADAVLFAGGIGENAAPVREAIAGELAALGVEFDAERNRALPRGGEGPVSAPGSRVAVWVVPTNEELLIARDTRDAIAAAP